MPSCDLCGDETEHDWPDQVFCQLCHGEILNWARGYSHARPDWLLSAQVPIAERGWIDEDQIRCYLCGVPARDLRRSDMHMEHVFPRALGGSGSLPNIALACVKCNSAKGGRVVKFTDEQMGRYQDLHRRMAVRYAHMKPHIPAAVLQGATAEMWWSWGFDEDGFEPGDTTANWAVGAVVSVLAEALRNNENDYPPNTFPDYFAECCLEHAKPIVAEYSRRNWFAEPVDDVAVADLVAASVREESDNWVAGAAWKPGNPIIEVPTRNPEIDAQWKRLLARKKDGITFAAFMGIDEETTLSDFLGTNEASRTDGSGE